MLNSLSPLLNCSELLSLSLVYLCLSYGSCFISVLFGIYLSISKRFPLDNFFLLFCPWSIQKTTKEHRALLHRSPRQVDLKTVEIQFTIHLGPKFFMVKSSLFTNTFFRPKICMIKSNFYCTKIQRYLDYRIYKNCTIKTNHSIISRPHFNQLFLICFIGERIRRDCRR